MQFTDFKTHLTDVTKPVLAAYRQDIDHDWQQAVTGKYNSDIAYHLFKTLVATDEVDNATDLDEFVVDTSDDLRELLTATFKDHTIYEFDPALTAQIKAYFADLGIDIFNNLHHATLGNPQKFKDLAPLETQVNTYLYVVVANDADLADELNWQLFAGEYGRNDSIKRFLTTN